MATLSINIENGKQHYDFNVNKTTIKTVLDYLNAVSEAKKDKALIEEIEFSFKQARMIQDGLLPRRTIQQMIDDK
ncbi:MAG: hypothetical protein ACOYOV_16965 [Bacteroidales bacterium]